MKQSGKGRFEYSIAVVHISQVQSWKGRAVCNDAAASEGGACRSFSSKLYLMILETLLHFS